MSPRNAAVSADDIAASPAWYPLELSGSGEMRLVRLDEAAYRAASFLDRRILQSTPEQAIVPCAAVASAAARLRPRAHYLFHIGHVGSTLLSRLIGDDPGYFCLREPTLLRAMALDPRRLMDTPDLRAVLSLLSRTWHAEQRAVVKATSFVSELAERVLEIDDSARAIFLYTPPLAYLCCILAADSSRVEARTLAASRLTRLERRIGAAVGPAAAAAEGELIAMSWLAEMTALGQAAARFAARILWLDFDRFLASPAGGMADAFRSLGATPEPSRIGALLAGPLMRRYSKAPEHAYDAALRRAVLASAAREHAVEVRRGMAWLARLTGRHPLIDAALAS